MEAGRRQVPEENNVNTERATISEGHHVRTEDDGAVVQGRRPGLVDEGPPHRKGHPSGQSSAV